MPRRPTTITAAAALEALVGLVLLGEACYILVNTVLGRATDLTFAIPLIVFAFAGAGVIGYVAWGLYTLHDWARTPVVLTQIFALVIAYYLLTSAQYALSAGVAVVAAAALVLVLLPPSTAALYPDGPENRRG
ncbi:hypothetical protein CLV63_108149 [Murinocardiopsis flavida]|uniref:Integral membrane protein n=1 Tax=Murinocardiopsis flavida TaxID=645275 RepID=A0A2P8DJR4_9ACTN|nr:hypothetical protein [Murinocardiopsis flavida]PSK97429.1 hypothetical protein CLV63_108149 [Murinocardiopsis flavida]